MRQQGPVSWAAAAAVAAGAALLAGAAWSRLRRRPSAGTRRADPPAEPRTATGGATRTTDPTVPPTAVPAARLEELHARLAHAAARLDALRIRRAAAGASALKTAADPVDHVHRSGHA